MSLVSPFHLAFPVHDLTAARAFYGGLLGCPEGRSSSEWIDFDFFGHQLVAHLAPEECGNRCTNDVDGHQVPVRHYGCMVLLWMTKKFIASRRIGVRVVNLNTLRKLRK